MCVCVSQTADGFSQPFQVRVIWNLVETSAWNSHLAYKTWFEDFIICLHFINVNKKETPKMPKTVNAEKMDFLRHIKSDQSETC